MRSVPASLQKALDSGATTLARAWTLTRRDGTRLGFTDHDRPLVLDGVTHEATSGLTGAAVERGTGLSVDNHTVQGTLRSAAISEADLERGVYDGAEILFWLVDWTDPQSRLLEGRGTVAEIRRGEHAFEAEIAGLAERMNQPIGRAYLRTCDRRLGDAGCGVDLSGPAFRGIGTVTDVLAPARWRVSGLNDFESRWFDRGAVSWTEGANAGGTGHVKAHRATEGAVEIELWQAPPLAVGEGDAFAVTAGCDKTAATCGEKFANFASFGGFPHLPGDDWAIGYPNTGEGHDGGSLYRG